MPRPSKNLFVRLHKWASRQDENFLSESFAYLLQHLLDHEVEAAITLIDQVTEGVIRVEASDAKLIEIDTQEFYAEGTPDISIASAQALAFIEVKSESNVDREQLDRYRALLNRSGFERTGLILVTRYPSPEADGIELDASIRWYEIGEWLEALKAKYSFRPVSHYLVDQFLGFLGARNMVMGQVTWELGSGVRAMRNLVEMLYEAASTLKLHAQVAGTKEWMGVYLERRKYWAGIYFEQPEILIFGTDYQKVDPQLAAQLGIEGVHEWESGGPGFAWTREVNLEAEDIHFFARSKASQMQFLHAFLKECLDTVKKIELSEPPETPPESDENAE